VRLACSPHNTLVLPDGRRVRKWDAISRVLRRPISNADDLVVCRGSAAQLRWHHDVLTGPRGDGCVDDQAAIRAYNTQHHHWTFGALKAYCTGLDERETTQLFGSTVRRAPAHIHMHIETHSDTHIHAYIQANVRFLTMPPASAERWLWCGG
jgi:hypothetical protein